MKNLIDECMRMLPQLTKDEADLIETVLKWNNERQAAFLLAKRLFENKDEDGYV